MVIVDTSVMIDYFAGRVTWQTDWLNRNIGALSIGITTLILSEILQGIRNDGLFVETLKSLDQLAVFEAGHKELAVVSAINYRRLRKIGITIRSIVDCNTATFCIEERHELLHNDRDFDPFEVHLGLQVVHPQLPDVR